MNMIRSDLHKMFEIAFLFDNGGVDSSIPILDFLVMQAGTNIVYGSDTLKDIAHGFGITLICANNIRSWEPVAQFLLRSFATDDEAEVCVVFRQEWY